MRSQKTIKERAAVLSDSLLSCPHSSSVLEGGQEDGAGWTLRHVPRAYSEDQVPGAPWAVI